MTIRDAPSLLLMSISSSMSSRRMHQPSTEIFDRVSKCKLMRSALAISWYDLGSKANLFSCMIPECGGDGNAVETTGCMSVDQPANSSF